MIASGKMLGPNTHVVLKLLDIEPAMNGLRGCAMELEDCAYPLLDKVEYGFDPKQMFADCDIVICLGGFPRKAGMERKELLQKNCNIFKEQGAAANEVCKQTTKFLVVANPANTNALILSHFAPNLPKKNFSCLTRLDHNRAKAQIAIKAGARSENVKNVIIWGNHSST
jgi:malate dehydrogenase